MTNLNILETFRTKEELLNYFEAIGQSITEEEIENLKRSYEQAQENNNALSLQQLDDVAGGGGWVAQVYYDCNRYTKIKTNLIFTFMVYSEQAEKGLYLHDYPDPGKGIHLHCSELKISPGTKFGLGSPEMPIPEQNEAFCRESVRMLLTDKYYGFFSDTDVARAEKACAYI